MFILSKFYKYLRINSFFILCPDPVSQSVAEFFAQIQSHARRTLALSSIFSGKGMFEDTGKICLLDSHTIVPHRQQSSPGSPAAADPYTGLLFSFVFHTVAQK